MNLPPNSLQLDRRTAADELFDKIRDDIHKMRLLPGTKISEADIAKRYEVSRQPVREAFIRLNNLSLLDIRPQKATIVRRISKSAIRQSRFVRVAVEIEVAHRACQIAGSDLYEGINSQLEQQIACLEKNDIAGFHDLDAEFHGSICQMAKCDFAVDVIKDCKAKVDRLCMLSLAHESDAKQVYSDHVTIAKHLMAKDKKKLVAAIRDHLSRLDSTIEYIQTHNSSYFED